MYVRSVSVRSACSTYRWGSGSSHQLTAEAAVAAAAAAAAATTKTTNEDKHTHTIGVYNGANNK